MELTSAIPAAADAPVKKREGIGQNGGLEAYIPHVAIHTAISDACVPDKSPAAKRPIDVTRQPAIRCQRRSRNESDDHPPTSRPSNPKTYGADETMPVIRF